MAARPLALAALAGLLLAAAPARAIIYLDNLAAPNVNATQVTLPAVYFGPSFTTDSSASSFSLTSVTLQMNGGLSGNFFSLRLFSDVGGKPGIVLATGAGSASPSNDGDYVYTFSSLLLQPATTYWTVIGYASPGTGQVSWDTAATSAVGAWTTSGPVIAISPDNGASWNITALGTTFYIQSVAATPTAIPEPATCALGAGFAALALAYYRRRR
jgi:hypothetical protein